MHYNITVLIPLQSLYYRSIVCAHGITYSHVRVLYKKIAEYKNINQLWVGMAQI